MRNTPSAVAVLLLVFVSTAFALPTFITDNLEAPEQPLASSGKRAPAKDVGLRMVPWPTMKQFDLTSSLTLSPCVYEGFWTDDASGDGTARVIRVHQTADGWKRTASKLQPQPGSDPGSGKVRSPYDLPTIAQRKSAATDVSIHMLCERAGPGEALLTSGLPPSSPPIAGRLQRRSDALPASADLHLLLGGLAGGGTGLQPTPLPLTPNGSRLRKGFDLLRSAPSPRICLSRRTAP